MRVILLKVQLLYEGTALCWRHCHNCTTLLKKIKNEILSPINYSDTSQSWVSLSHVCGKG